MGEKKLFSVMMMAAVLFAPGCGDGNGGDEDADAQPDTDAAEDTLPDPHAAEEPADVPQEDGIEDPAEEEAPETCSGSDTLTLEFVDGDENPVEGVAVALRCLSEVREGTSGSDGLVSFDNLDLAETPVDFTYVYWDMAFSVVAMGGETPIPDPLRISLDRNEDTLVTMRGNAVHTTPGSTIMVVTSVSYYNVTDSDTYEVTSGTGTGLGLTALEYVFEGDTINMVGYSHQYYDLASGSEDGPDAAPSSTADLRTMTIQLDYELAADSPLQDKLIDRNNATALGNSGFFLLGMDSMDGLIMTGLTTEWVTGESYDTLEISWAQDGVDTIVTSTSCLGLRNTDFTADYGLMLTEDLADWETSYTIFDVPEIPGQEPEVAFPFDQELEVVHPDWAAPYSVMAYNIRASGSQPINMGAPFFWCVTVHPDATSFSFAQLPLPSTITYEDLFISSTMWTGASVVSYDEDPVQDAELLANSRCGLVNTDLGPRWLHKAKASDLRYRIYAP